MILQSSTEYQPGYVLARLLSFSLILVGIIYKNSTPRP
ncbi:hypothetical protein LF41_1178 [Lysobacter dokdonensis DS-58]|uniref:Uncharacterized protein n=1 Tax=Lysobacter dokdonensis DS-58 TaxID=1300345 RepID=A0A0A2WQT6_9GAMM|nr:hypothetical protein LF41_1178 [Lysobacter dokdonensis DS-58]